MANLGGDLFGDILKIAEENKKAYGIPFGQQSDAPCAKCHQAIKPGEMTTNEGMGGAEQHVNCPWMGSQNMPARQPAGQSAYASTEKKADEALATDWAKVKQWMEANAREFDNATNLAESAANQFNLYEGDFDIPVEVFDIAHEVMYDDNFDVRSNVMSDNHEFSDIGGAPKIDVTKTAEPALEIGDEGIGTTEQGQKFKGTVEKSEGGKITLRSLVNSKIVKEFPAEKVESLEQRDRKNKEIKERDEAEKSEQEKAEEAARNERLTLKPEDVQGSYDALANYLTSSGNYTLRADPSDAQLEAFDEKYHELTGEELNATGRPKAQEHEDKGGWILQFPDSPEVRQYIPWQIDVAKSGLAPLRGGQYRAVINPKTNKLTIAYNAPIWEMIKRGLRQNAGMAAENKELVMSSSKKACGDCNCQVDEEVVLPAAKEVPEGSTGERQLPPAETKMPESEKEAGFNLFFPGQVTEQFYPEILHEMVDYPNDNNSPVIEDIDIDNAMDTNKLSYVSTSPAGAMGIGRDGKPQILEGAPLRKENDIRGEAFLDEFHQQYEGVPAALLTVAAKVAAKDEKGQFELFLKRVMAEIAAAFIAAYKVTGRTILNMVPGIGEVQLAQVEQPSSLSSFNIVNTGSRVKYLLDKLNDGDVRDAVNKARAQAAVWIDDPNGGFVYEVFARAESIDTDTMIMKYTFIIGTKESENA